MEAKTSDGYIEVRLSRRNLMSLLTKLDHDGSANTIYRILPDVGCVKVTAEPDDVHYGDRTPGLMVDFTEKDIRAVSNRGWAEAFASGEAG